MSNFLFYSIGGGGGHFNRSLAMILALLRNPDNIIYWIHSSPFDFAIQNLHPRIKSYYLPKNKLRGPKIEKILTKLSGAIDLLLVDTFIKGINNELLPFLNQPSFPVR
ncbi:MAG: hypothetical protein ACXAC7_08090, partial [Candidatus Hodarchaeales archaeon]